MSYLTEKVTSKAMNDFTVSGAHNCNITIPSITQRLNFRRTERVGNVNFAKTKFNSRRTEPGGRFNIANAMVQFWMG